MYKKGDIVKIRSDLKAFTHYDGIYVSPSMTSYAGLSVIISEVTEKYMEIQGDAMQWSWLAEMFESVKPKLFKLL